MKKLALIAALALALPLAAMAQTTTPAKPATTPAAAKHAAAKTAAKAEPKKRQVTRRAAKAVEEVTPVTQEVDVELTEADLAVARRVSVGRAQCELGADVSVQLDEKKPGYFTVTTKSLRFRMHPVESRTGAIRLEDPRQGAVWLQLGNKSMLMNQTAGLRIADECQTAEQVAFAEEMKKNPPKSLFEGADAPANTKSTEAAAPAAAPAPTSTAKKTVKK
jgi:Ni/Co efflux regulator RcnB